MEAGDVRKAREHIDDFAGFLPDSKQKKHFVMSQPSLFDEQLHRPISPALRSDAAAYG